MVFFSWSLLGLINRFRFVDVILRVRCRAGLNSNAQVITVNHAVRFVIRFPLLVPLIVEDLRGVRVEVFKDDHAEVEIYDVLNSPVLCAAVDVDRRRLVTLITPPSFLLRLGFVLATRRAISGVERFGDYNAAQARMRFRLACFPSNCEYGKRVRLGTMGSHLFCNYLTFTFRGLVTVSVGRLNAFNYSVCRFMDLSTFRLHGSFRLVLFK